METFGTNDPSGYAGGLALSAVDDGPESTIEDSTITGNTSGRAGGGMRATGATVVDTTISGNQADVGGGLYLEASSIRSTTISGNTAGTGGGVYASGSDGNSTIRNSTIADNSATGGFNPYPGQGGGVFVFGEVKYNASGPPSIRLRTSTVAGNSAAARGGNLFAYYDGTLEEPFVELSGTLVADGTAPSASDVGESVGGSFAAGFSLIESTAGASVVGDPDGSNVLGVDPLLGTLADNGGPTRTKALSPTSPAIDAGRAFGATTDQRGQARPVDAAAANEALGDGADIGAYELSDVTATGDDDVTAPTTELTKKPKRKLKAKGKRNLAKAKYRFRGADGGGGPVTFECRLDKGKFEPCDSPVKEKLDPGKHTFQVRAVDAAGNTDPTPARSKTKVKRKRKKN